MNVKINSRGNGTCPDCRHRSSCPVHTELKKQAQPFHDHDDTGLETVIFNCPVYKPR